MYIVYIIHFSRPFHHANHYIGMTGERLLERFKRHKNGSGAKITSAVVKAGIKLRCLIKLGEFNTAIEARQFEIKLKRRKESKKFCWICKGSKYCPDCKGWGYKNIRIENGQNVYDDCLKCKKTGKIKNENIIHLESR